MSETEEQPAALFPERVGDRLRAARTKAGMDLADVATRTRIPQRHLTAIEAGDYGALPALTYAVGFTKAYARAVDVDEVEIARDLREELGLAPGHRGIDHSDYDTADPARVPPRALAWTALAVAVLVAALYGGWRSGWFDGLGGGGVPAAEAPAPLPSVVPAAGPVQPSQGEVVLTAREPVWFRVYDANDKVLFEGEKKAGESFAVPADANNPMIRTGRADQIKVTVGGAEVPPLGPAETTVKDVGVSAAALGARGAAPAIPAAQKGVQP
jgi:cytoskeletal protein RodZ